MTVQPHVEVEVLAIAVLGLSLTVWFGDPGGQMFNDDHLRSQSKKECSRLNDRSSMCYFSACVWRHDIVAKVVIGAPWLGAAAPGHCSRQQPSSYLGSNRTHDLFAPPSFSYFVLPSLSSLAGVLLTQTLSAQFP